MSLQEPLNTAVARRKDSLKKVACMAKLGGHDMAAAIQEKTMKEVQGGTMAGPFSLSQLETRHGRFFNITPSFGLHQGFKEDGTNLTSFCGRA